MMDEFIGYRFTQLEPPHEHPPFDFTYYWPYVLSEEPALAAKEERIPPDELAIHRGAMVEASDGPVSQLDEFLVDPSDSKITHLILREGH